MPSKTEEYLALAQRTANGLTRYWENWTDYLTTASRLYKYSFADQLMIYAQRPDATACASFDIWNNRMNRYVRRGSKGIALLDQSSSVPRLHYVFDVSDTGVRRNSRDPEVWQLGPDLMQPVSEMIAREYGVYHERLSQQISDLTGKLVDSYWDNNSGDILDIVDGSFLIDYDEAGQEFQFKSAAAISILYTVLERCGLEPDGHFDRDDFQAIFSFSTPAAVYALGTAVSECSRDVLRNIERTVKTTIRRRNVERSQYEYEQQERDLLDRRGLPAPEPDPAPAGESTGQIRQTAPDLPDEASPGAVQFDAPVGDSASAPVGSGTDGREPDAADHAGTADVFGVSMDDLVNYEKTDRENLGLEVPPKGKHVFGMVKVGDKGQIVIPANARKIFDIQPGDNLLILGDEEQGIAILKEKSFLEHLRLMERMRHIESGE